MTSQFNFSCSNEHSKAKCVKYRWQKCSRNGSKMGSEAIWLVKSTSGCSSGIHCNTTLKFDTAISLMHNVPHAKSMFSKIAGWRINTVESKFHLNDWLSMRKCPNHYMCSWPSSLCMQWSGQTARSGGIITESAQTLIAYTKAPIVLSVYGRVCHGYKHSPLWKDSMVATR